MKSQLNVRSVAAVLVNGLRRLRVQRAEDHQIYLHKGKTRALPTQLLQIQAERLLRQKRCRGWALLHK